MNRSATLQPLGELVDVSRRTINPAALDETRVHHYSIPAYDAGRDPDEVAAKEIRSQKLSLSAPAVLVSKINPHIPRCWLVEPSQQLPALASTEFLPLAPKNGSIELDYVYAVCSSKPFQRALGSLVTGTSSSHQRVKPRDLLSVAIPVVARAEQRRIGCSLRMLERRIRITRDIARLTDRLMSCRFRELFGAGTGETPLSEVSTIFFGVSYRSSDLTGNDQALVTLKSFGRTGGYREVGLKAWSGEAKPGQILGPGDVVVAQTDLTQAADVLGRVALVRGSERFSRLVASLDVAIVRPSEDVEREYLYGLLSQPEFRRYCRSRANGTTVLHLSRRAIPEYGISRPKHSELAAYVGAARPIGARMLLADEELAILEGIRANFLMHAFGA